MTLSLLVHLWPWSMRSRPYWALSSSSMILVSSSISWIGNSQVNIRSTIESETICIEAPRWLWIFGVKAYTHPDEFESYSCSRWMSAFAWHQALHEFDWSTLVLNHYKAEHHICCSCSQPFLHAPWDSYLQTAHHLLIYIKSTLSLGLFFYVDSSMQIRGFADADWATCPDTRRSITSFCMFIDDSLIS